MDASAGSRQGEWYGVMMATKPPASGRSMRWSEKGNWAVLVETNVTTSEEKCKPRRFLVTWLVWRLAYLVVRRLRRHYERQIGTAWNCELSLTVDRLLVAEEVLR